MNLFFLRRSLWPIDQIKAKIGFSSEHPLACSAGVQQYEPPMINKQLSPAQDTPALQAKRPSAVEPESELR